MSERTGRILRSVLAGLTAISGVGAMAGLINPRWWGLVLVAAGVGHAMIEAYLATPSTPTPIVAPMTIPVVSVSTPGVNAVVGEPLNVAGAGARGSAYGT